MSNVLLQNPLLFKMLDFGIFMAQFSLERQAKMREEVAKIPASATPEQIDVEFERISKQALDELQASIDHRKAGGAS